MRSTSAPRPLALETQLETQRSSCSRLHAGIVYLVDETDLPTHQITGDDIQIHAADAQVCVLPTFLFRRAPERMVLDLWAAHADDDNPAAADENPADLEQRRDGALATFAAFLVNLLSGQSRVFSDREELSEAIELVDDEDAYNLLSMCDPACVRDQHPDETNWTRQLDTPMWLCRTRRAPKPQNPDQCISPSLAPCGWCDASLSGLIITVSLSDE